MFFTNYNYLFSDTCMFKSLGWVYVGSSLLFASFVYFKILFMPIDTQKTIKDKPEESPAEKYIEKYKKRFENSYNNGDLNQNIQPEFYNKDQYNLTIKIQDNILEKSWKQRILFESTPNGNIVMFYDAYRFSFTYYSDSHIPYPILNAVAMKYVLTYFCRDFFLDKSIIPPNQTTPFLYVHEIEKKEPNQKKIDVSKGPFAKLKNYTKVDKDKVEKKIDDKENNDKKTSVVKNYIKNKFISLGKVYNFSVLKNTLVLDNIQPKQAIPLDYSSFKKWHNPSNLSLVKHDDIDPNYADVFS